MPTDRERQCRRAVIGNVTSDDFGTPGLALGIKMLKRDLAGRVHCFGPAAGEPDTRQMRRQPIAAQPLDKARAFRCREWRNGIAHPFHRGGGRFRHLTPSMPDIGNDRAATRIENGIAIAQIERATLGAGDVNDARRGDKRPKIVRHVVVSTEKRTCCTGQDRRCHNRVEAIACAGRWSRG